MYFICFLFDFIVIPLYTCTEIEILTMMQKKMSRLETQANTQKSRAYKAHRRLSTVTIRTVRPMRLLWSDRGIALVVYRFVSRAIFYFVIFFL